MASLKEQIVLGRWEEAELHALIAASSEIREPGRRIEYLSRPFLGVPYQAATLRGDQTTEEVLVINLGAVDCFTFIDYVEAMRLSVSFAGFREALKRVRYRSGVVGFSERNHFFSDWVRQDGGSVRDVTGIIGGFHAVSTPKTLNMREDGTLLIPGVAPREKVVTYIPGGSLRGPLLDRLRTGDYAGIYSPRLELDVSHVGIIVRDGEAILFRHASSAAACRRVVDEDFVGYVCATPGIVVLRPEGSAPADRPFIGEER
jgi:hypothetical protein